MPISAPASCADILGHNPAAPDGSYTIYPGGNIITVWCDMTYNGGGWTLVWTYEFTDYANFGADSNAGNMFNIFLYFPIACIHTPKKNH